MRKGPSSEHVPPERQRAGRKAVAEISKGIVSKCGRRVGGGAHYTKLHFNFLGYLIVP